MENNSLQTAVGSLQKKYKMDEGQTPQQIDISTRILANPNLGPVGQESTFPNPLNVVILTQTLNRKGQILNNIQSADTHQSQQPLIE